MIVSTLAHGKLVLDRLYARSSAFSSRWIVFDTETQPQPGYESGDALIIGRTRIRVFSACCLGEAYCFFTSAVDSRYPTESDWLRVLDPFFSDKKLVKVFHNANYDYNVFHTAGCRSLSNFYCTMIGAWKAWAAREKGLKARAPYYGRHLFETSTVSFANPQDLADYAEQDVVVADELYQMQTFGKIQRPKRIMYLHADRTISSVPNPLPAGEVAIEHEALTTQDKWELRLQEFPYLRSTLDAQLRGFPIDRAKLRQIRQTAARDKDQILRRILKVTGPINLNSPKQLGKVMESLGIESPEKTKKGAPSWNAKALYKLQGVHSLIQDLAQYRKVEKLQSVYIGDPTASTKGEQLGLEYFISPRDGAIHASSNTVGAITGRTSSSNPNLTQIPARSDTYGIRDIFIAPRKEVLIVLDYAQLELRVGCLMSRDPAMSRVLSDPKGDIHSFTANEFGVPRDPTAKQINFLLIYGGGNYVLSEQLTVNGVPTTVEVAQSYIDRFNQVYHRYKAWREELLEEHRANGFVRLFTGRRRALEDINWENRFSVHKAETTLANNTVQGSGQDFLKIAIVRTDHRRLIPDSVALGSNLSKNWSPSHRAYLKDRVRLLTQYRKDFERCGVRWLLQVHDESIWRCADRKAAVDMATKLARVMTWRHVFPGIRSYNVPLVAEGGVGETWKQAKAKGNPLHVSAGFEL